MSRIIVAAQNVIGAGAKVIGHALLPHLCRRLAGNPVRVLLPDTPEYRGLDLGDAERRFFRIASNFRNDLARLWQLFVSVPREVSDFRADACLTLADLGPVELPCRHVVFLHQPLLVYSQKELRDIAGWNPSKRRFMMRHFARGARRAHSVVVQTEVMADRLARWYPVRAERIRIIPQVLPLAATDADAPRAIRESPAELKLVFLSQFYPHKNHLILPALCAELRTRGLGERVHFFLTLRAEDTSMLPPHSLEETRDMVTNVGALSRAEVYSALRACSALFLPTVAESYGLVYLEAMSCGTPILTSDRDFAHCMCGDLARYFEPFDPVSIADVIEGFLRDGAPRLERPEVDRRFARLPAGWDAVADSFASELC